MKASVSIPLCNHSVSIGRHSYYDGGFVDNIPVYPLTKHDLDYIICIYFDDENFKFENKSFDKKIIKLVFPPENGLRQSLILKPDTINQMIQDGFDRATSILQTIFHNGYEDKEYIYSAIDVSNSSTAKRDYRITVDILATNLNRFTKKLTTPLIKE